MLTSLAEALAEVMKVLAHPDRIRIIEKLGEGESSVSMLAADLGIPSARVSQHLALLKAHRLVEERADGTFRFYRLAQSHLARWLTDGIAILDARAKWIVAAQEEINTARRLDAIEKRQRDLER